MENLTVTQCGLTSECGPQVLQAPPAEIAATLNVIGGKWKILILWQLLKRTCRFNELRRAIPGVSQHMLTSHLRELEQEGVLVRTVFAEVPPRVEYALTDHGQQLGVVMRSLADWGAAHLRQVRFPSPGEDEALIAKA